MKLEILLVDDFDSVLEFLEANINHIIKNSFPDLEYTFHKFTSVKDFIESESNYKYDIAIIDWNIGTSENEKGDKIINKISPYSKNICIYTGMLEDAKEIVNYASKMGIRSIFKKSTDMSKINNFITKSLDSVDGISK